jgi:hypothetical protein
VGVEQMVAEVGVVDAVDADLDAGSESGVLEVLADGLVDAFVEVALRVVRMGGKLYDNSWLL